MIFQFEDAITGGSFSYSLAHGLGGRADLPISLQATIAAAVIVLLATFALLNSRWDTSRLESTPESESNLVARRTTSLIGLTAFLILVIVAAFGANASSDNPAPTWFYVWLWVGLVPLSLLFGPVYAHFNPIRPLAAVLRRIVPTRWQGRAYPDRFGYWPATFWLLAFVWLELVKSGPDKPSTVATFVLLYLTFNLVGAVGFDDTWHRKADAFEVYSRFLALLAPLKWSQWRPSFQNPLKDLTTFPTTLSASAFVWVLLGSTAFDGLTRTQTWTNLSAKYEGSWSLGLVGSLGLAAAIAAVAVTYLFACFMAAPSAKSSGLRRTGAFATVFAHSLLPVAIGYTVAHYFSLLVFQGQAGFVLSGDPFDQGWNLLGLSTRSIDYLLISSNAIGIIQVLAILLGHVAGIVAAHDRSIALLQADSKSSGQYPLAAVMVGYTMAGLALLFSA